MGIKEPWQMSRDKWERAVDDLRVCHGFSALPTKASGSQETARIGELERLFFGVCGWLMEKALKGDTEALEMVEFNIYDKYEQVIKKAKEEGKL